MNKREQVPSTLSPVCLSRALLGRDTGGLYIFLMSHLLSEGKGTGSGILDYVVTSQLRCYLTRHQHALPLPRQRRYAFVDPRAGSVPRQIDFRFQSRWLFGKL
jgi:hypothetical protein